MNGKKIVIAYGDAGFASNSKNELSAPTTTLQKECSKWYSTVKIDEFRTTKLHYETGKVVETSIKNPFAIKSNKMPVEEILSESSWLELFNYSINHKSNKWQKTSLMDNIFYPRQLELYLRKA